jgi:hypothetical protein
MRILTTTIAALLTVAITSTAQAFCGFYVSKADTSLFNQASQVVLVRDKDRTVITMANDYQGDAQDFAVVIPVPTFIERDQINVGDRSLIDHLDAYTAPRLVEYHDPDPCSRDLYDKMPRSVMMESAKSDAKSMAGVQQGVTIEATYTVGEYDILILSASESDGLITWLKENNYRIPDGAEPVVRSYLKQDMRFFVAKVNLEEQSRLGFANLRPLQVAYESDRFMLPIRLGTVNAKEQQELFVYTLTRTGRVETTNYRTVKLPSNTELPEHVEEEFGDFYRALFDQQTNKENDNAVFLEYAWDMGWCDPCAADPLSTAQLRQLGVFWVGEQAIGQNKRQAGTRLASAPQDVFVTRLHVRYDGEHFPEDLMLQETGDRQNFQGRYVIRHPWKGAAQCDMTEYEASVRDRQELEAQTLANLTGWDLDGIRAKISFLGDAASASAPWWKRLWQ